MCCYRTLGVTGVSLETRRCTEVAAHVRSVVRHVAVISQAGSQSMFSVPMLATLVRQNASARRFPLAALPAGTHGLTSCLLLLLADLGTDLLLALPPLYAGCLLLLQAAVNLPMLLPSLQAALRRAPPPPAYNGLSSC